MKLVKTSVIACALSALLAGPVLAQGVSSDTKARGGVQGKSMQGGMTGSDDEDSSAQPSTSGQKMGMKSTKSTKGTVGSSGSAAHKGTTEDTTPGSSTSTGKRY
jgi:hypothetical protein